MSFAIVPAYDIPLAEQATIANRAFAGYVAGWAEMDAAALARFLWLQGADLFTSRFVSVDGQLAGFGYINRTGNIPRLAGMALEPFARGTGASAFLLRHLCDEAKLRGEPAMVLEVIQQNPRGHAFYRREGFREIDQLHSWRRPGESVLPTSSEAEEIPLLDALRMATALDYPTVPWQITGYAAAKVTGARAYRAGHTAVVISNPDDASPIRVHGFRSAAGDWAELQGALASVMRRFAGREFFAPAVFPEEFGLNIFAPLGFHRDTLSQFLMRRDF